MVKIKKYANGIERFLHGEKGQRFFNFAYSIGAAIVIWGALFKILHLPGGSTLLCIGMGTEIAMFILTAFDRPPKDYAWEEVFPALDKNHEHTDIAGEEADRFVQDGLAGVGGIPVGAGVAPQGASYPSGQWQGEPQTAYPTQPQAGLQLGVAPDDAATLHDSITRLAAASEQLSQMAELASATQDYLSQIAAISQQMAELRQTTHDLNQVSGVLLDSYRAITDNSGSISENSSGYADRMADLNRNIGGLNTIYEIQLKSISSQLESIDRVNRGLKDIRDMYEKSAEQSSRYCEETEKMARYMKQLNSVYEKMITAMTINMYNPMMGGARPGDFNPFDQESGDPNAPAH